MELKNYQIDAIDKLLKHSCELLNLESEDTRKILFTSPTGSGKTIMMAELLKQLTEEVNDLSFIWNAPRKLHGQSKDKLEKYYEPSRSLSCAYFEDLKAEKIIEENQILFLNWESINKDKNIYIRENESDFYLNKVIENTRDSGRKVVLIIDESHHAANTDISKELVNDISPNLIIYISATPKEVHEDQKINVLIEHVKKESMIKSGISINPGFEKYSDEEDNLILEVPDDSTSFWIKEALEKRKELFEEFAKLNRDVNPLLLIQLPRKISPDDEMKNKIISILASEHGIDEENGKLIVYLSNDKSEGMDTVHENNDIAEVVIFKEALNLGWDCPRAQILLLFREWHDGNFAIQTIGRIIRMPEPEIGYYENNDLNLGYIFTDYNIARFADEEIKGFVKIYSSKRSANYKDIELPYSYRIRRQEKTRLTGEFRIFFENEARSYKLKEKLNSKPTQLKHSMFADETVKNLDSAAKDGEIEAKHNAPIDDIADLQRYFNASIRRNLSPFYSPITRSIDILTGAIDDFFRKEFSLSYKQGNENLKKIINIFLDGKNQKYFSKVIGKALERHKERHGEDESDDGIGKGIWEVPDEMNFGEKYKLMEVQKSIMQPFYINKKWKTEAAFIKEIDKSDKVEWWFKNGETDAHHFAISYINENKSSLFYIDFIIKFKDGRIGLFDTKSGTTRKNAGPKSNRLKMYISDNKNKKCFGGIIANKDEKEFTREWVYFTGGAQYISDMENSRNWKELDL